MLAGGYGTRLRGVVGACPKVVAPVAGRPFLGYVLHQLRQAGIHQVVLCTGHLGEMVVDALGDGSRFGLRLRYLRESQPLGTAGALRAAVREVGSGPGPLVVLNGDSLVEADLAAMLQAHQRWRAGATMLVARTGTRGRFGAVAVDREGRIVAFDEKGPAGEGLVNAGVYLIEPEVLEGIPGGRAVSLEREVFPRLLGSLWAQVVNRPPDRHRNASLVRPGPELLFRGSLAGDLVMTSAASSNSVAVGETDRQWARLQLLESARTAQRIAESCLPATEMAALAVASALAQGGKLLLCGNGGSAADCQHLAAEFTNRLTPERERPALAALALSADSCFLTAHANDHGFATVFSRQVEGLGRCGDVLLVLSTTGNSENVVRAVQAARKLQLRTIGMLGGSGGRAGKEVELAITVPSSDIQRVQEGHLAVGHVLVGLVERLLFPGPDGESADGQQLGQGRASRGVSVGNEAAQRAAATPENR